jgi:hypothetical protein
MLPTKISFRYQFLPQFVHVNGDGSVRGGLSQLVAI